MTDFSSTVTCLQSSQKYCFEYQSVNITSSKDKLENIRDVLDIILSWDPFNFKKIKYKNVIAKQDESFGI